MTFNSQGRMVGAYSEPGIRTDEVHFDTEQEACQPPVPGLGR